MNQSRIDPALLEAVVRIECPEGVTLKPVVGTGFIVSSEPDPTTSVDRQYFLVTNKHMIGDWTLADGTIEEYYRAIDVSFYGPSHAPISRLRIPITDGKGRPIENRIRIAQDPSVDVAAIFLNEAWQNVEQRLRFNSFEPSFLLRFDRITTWLTGLGDQVFALGYPMGVTSIRSSHPIAKAGYLSTVPGEVFAIDVPCKNRQGDPVVTRLEGKLLVVDGLIVPGNSGGPVVLPSELKIRRDPDTNQLHFATQQTKNYVIGIVSCGLTGSGLTLVYSSDYVIDLVREFSDDLRQRGTIDRPLGCGQ